MAKVSLCMIVKNEETILERCLNSVVSIADQIIITDTGSTDKTVEIASRFTSEIKHFKWIDDFSAARNFCEATATNEYIMTWDADNILLEESLPFILKLKEDNFNDLDLIYGSWIVEFSLDKKPIKVLKKPLFFKKDLFYWESPIHNNLIQKDRSDTVKQKRFNQIKFTHHKDLNEKKHRYKQTRNILEKELAKKRKNPRLLFFYGEALLFDKEYESSVKVFIEYLGYFEDQFPDRAIAALEKIMLSNLYQKKTKENFQFIQRYKDKFYNSPIFLLTLADSTAAYKFEDSFHLYKKYCDLVIENKAIDLDQFTDFERFFIHPRAMLARHYLLKNQHDIAKKLLTEVIKKSAVEKSIIEAKKLLNLIER